MTKRAIAFHPPLFALHPVLALYASNVSLIPLPDLWAPCVVVVACSFVAWALASVVLRDVLRGAAVASAIALSFFMFGAVSDLLPRSDAYRESRPDPLAAYAVWGLLAVAVIALAGWKWKDRARVSLLLNLAGGLMCLFAVYSIVSAHVSINSELSRTRSRTTENGVAAATRPPDIFYIVLDGYGRDDVLRDEYGIESDALADQLEGRGFYVARDARSNYVQTQLSLASSLNLDLVQSLIQPMGDASRERLALDSLIDGSMAAETLKGLGYRTFAVTTGFPALTFPSADVSIKHDVGRSLFVDALLLKTPIPNSDNQIESQFDSRRKQLLGGFSEIKRLAKKGTAPRFVFVHILAPHPPFVFGPNGEPLRPRGNFAFSDGSHFVPQVGTAEEYRNGYRDQAIYIGKLLTETVDVLLDASGSKPVILVQGDHGPKSGLDQESAVNTDMNEVFPILSAYYVPDETRRKLYPSITPVNSLRVLFSSLFGMDLPLLEDDSFYSTWSDPLVFVNVTGKIAERH